MGYHFLGMFPTVWRRAGWMGIGLVGVLLVHAPTGWATEPAPLPAILPSHGLPDSELLKHWSPNPALEEQLRTLMRMRADESVEVRSFGDQEIQRRLKATQGSPAPLTVAPPSTEHAAFGITERQESNQPPCDPGVHGGH